MNYTDPDLRNQTIDLTNCDREPIHIPGRIQSFGALLGFTSDLIVTHASQNIEAGGRSSLDLIGEPLPDMLDPAALNLVRNRLQGLQGRDAVERLFGVDLWGDGELSDVALHLSGRTIIMEFEPSDTDRGRSVMSYVRPMIDRVGEAANVEQAARVAVRQLRALLGYDRIMCYRFQADGSGEVVAEAKTHEQPESFLNLRYPASDIPRQARAMYKRNLLRIIADIDAPVVPVDPPLIQSGQPLDLSLSTTRAVSPIHLEYLANMGVRATLAISLLVRGELWGMLVCHHYSPRLISYEMRTAAELFGQLFAFTLDGKLADSREVETARARVIHDQVMASLADGTSITDNFDTIADAIGTVVPHDGIVGWVDGVFTARGSVPTREQFLALARFLNTTPIGEVFSTDHIAAHHPPGEDFVGQAAGLLAIPVSRRPRDYLVMFRREAQREARWAGNPDKPVEVGPNGVRLTPRKSFEAWTETVRERSVPWTDGQRSAAESLRMTLLEVVLRMTDRAVEERTRAQEQQELLIAELNHRVRNILKLIQGLVSQSRDVADVSEFTETVGGRIHALARAHDQITQENWNPASVHDLLRTEAEAYLDEAKDCIRITGTDALLAPSAFTTVSLVLHEMLTNARKYGALSRPEGCVHVEFTETAKGDLEIQWREEGGPPVVAPSRRGFGSTITERSLPFELKGEAEVTYATTGVRARFRVPAEFIAEFTAAGTAAVAEPVREARPHIPGKALVVEDNLIIALDAEDLLRDLGASEVFTAPSVAEALSVLESQTVTFALLDVNLGVETSLPVARELQKRGVPFAFATGYGDRSEIAKDMPNVPVLQKPYGMDTVADAVRKLGLVG